MRKESRRLNREAKKEELRNDKKAWKELRKKQIEQGLIPNPKPTINNCKSKFNTREEEQQDRQNTIEDQLIAYRSLLPTIINKLSKIKDPRNPRKSKHKLSVVILYGIFMFVFQMSSRREATREMSRPAFLESLREMFPEIETMPHHDTLNRILSKIEVNDLENTLIDTVKKLIRNKKFANYLLKKTYMIAIDGSMKSKRDYEWATECLHKDHGKDGEENIKYYVNILESTMVFNNGITIPLFSEFMDNEEDKKSENKQDCETTAFKRLSKRIKTTFPRLSIMVLIDGLYANGPIIEICKKNKWGYMIVLQDKSLKTVWKDVNALKKIEGHEETYQAYGDRKQYIWWVNEIDYRYEDNARKSQILNVVVCEESWEVIDNKTGKIIEKKSKHAWISSEPLTQKNVHERCNLMGRYRWGIENGLLVEKHQGYSYTHMFSYNWKAMKGFHYLMHIAHLLNVLVQNTVNMVAKIKDMGKQGLIKYVKETLGGNWLNYEPIRKIVNCDLQLRLI